MRRTLVAVNTAPDSENRMHGDEARRYGFSSGLVPGVDVLAYLAHGGVEAWGAAWLGEGRLSGRLIAPVYDAEPVEVVTAPHVEPTSEPGSELGSSGSLDSSVIGADGSIRATAELSVPAPEVRAEVAERADAASFDIVAAPEPGERPPASEAVLQPGTALATQWARFHADRAQAYLDEISETHPAFRDEGLAHPGWLLRFANWALSSSVRLGPWIHVSSDAHLLAPVHDGDQLEVRARVTDRSERRGHAFVDLTALYLVDDRPVALVDHRAIWRPRLAEPDADAVPTSADATVETPTRG